MSTVQHWLRHDASGAGCAVPPGWARITVPGVAVAAVEPAGHGRFRASLVLTVVDNGGLTFAQWQARTDRMLPVTLRDYELVDLSRCPVAGAPGGRRLSRHRAANGRMLVLHQWFCAQGGAGVTLSATCDMPSYPRVDPWAHHAAARLCLPCKT